MKTALLVMVHGSPRAAANSDVFRVVARVKEQNLYDHVEVGFMECNEPTIPDAIELCVNAGVQRVVAVPYFLHTGKHVAEDLPALLDSAQARYPNIEFAMGRYIGASPRLTEILAERAAAAAA